MLKKELQFFLDNKVKQVKFVDRTFNCNHAHGTAIWRYILEHDNGVTNFHFEISADLLNEEELELLGVLKYFDTLTCGDMLKKSKPEPDIYLMACESLGIEPSEAVAIEDSYNGIRSAYRAGMVPVMVPDIIGPDEEMRELSKVICKDLKEVKKWFANEA